MTEGVTVGGFITVSVTQLTGTTDAGRSIWCLSGVFTGAAEFNERVSFTVGALAPNIRTVVQDGGGSDVTFGGDATMVITDVTDNDLTSFANGTLTIDYTPPAPTLAANIALVGTTQAERTTGSVDFGVTSLQVTVEGAATTAFTAVIEARPSANVNNVSVQVNANGWTIIDNSALARTFEVAYLVALTQVQDGNGDPIDPIVTHHRLNRNYTSFFPWYASVEAAGTVIDMISDFADADDQGRFNPPAAFDSGAVNAASTIHVAIPNADTHVFALNGFGAVPDGTVTTPSDNNAYRIYRFNINSQARLTVMT